MDNDLQYKEHVSILIRKLMHITRRLKYLSNIILSFVVISAVFFAIDAFTEVNRADELPLYYVLMIIFSITGIIFLYIFDQTKKNGFALYDVIGDSLEWIRLGVVRNENGKIKSDELKNRNRLNEEDASRMLSTQYALRLFIRSKDLPFFPGPNSQAGYLTIFLVLIVVGGMLKIISPV